MLGANKEVKEMQKGIKNAFNSVKEEMNMLRESINQENSDKQAIYEALNDITEEFNSKIAEVISRIEKLNERIDESKIYNSQENFNLKNIDLTNREKEVFLFIYSDNEITSVNELGRKLGFTPEMVTRYIDNMISKGIPLLYQYKDGAQYVSMDLKFKDLQAKKNIINIDESISKQLLSDKAI